MKQSNINRLAENNFFDERGCLIDKPNISAYFSFIISPIFTHNPVIFPHLTTILFPRGVFHSSSILRWQLIPSPFRLWWQNRHSRGCKPLPKSSHKPSIKKVHPFPENTSRAMLPSFPLNPGERTAKSFSGETSSIIRFIYCVCRTASASSTVHHPGLRQYPLQISQLHGSDGEYFSCSIPVCI
jgi:hypothetical protein